MKLIAWLAVGFLLFDNVFAVEAPLDRKGSSLKFTGHAFLHDFHGEAKEFSGAALIDGKKTELVVNAKIDIRAAAMTTFNAGRDKNMFQWLHVDVNPDIIFELTRVISMDGKAASATKEHPSQFIAFGNFTINKVTKAVQTQVAGWREGALLVVVGNTQIDTSSYGLPIIRRFWMSVDKEVDVNFRLSFDLPPSH